jgi:cobalt-zinc-cadmium efflux system outer membrane protein
MFSRLTQRLSLAWLMFGLAGCTCCAVREQTDRAICDLAAQTLDLEPAPAAEIPAPQPAREESSIAPQAPSDEIQTVAFQQPAKEQKKDGHQFRRLEIPRGLIGGDAPPFAYPKDATDEQKKEYRRKFFPPLPPLGEEPKPVPGPNGNPLTLSDLQRLTRANNPDIVRAVASVRAAEGAALQAGLHPNPSFGYVADTIGNAATAGFQGVFFDQPIKTAGKLQLAQLIASVDVANTRVALRAAENDAATRVRAAYFNVLVAQENVRVTRALATFTDEVYKVSFDLLEGTFAAPHEPMSLRSQVYQVRNSLIAARNSYQTAWRQLASAIGLPGMPATQLAGRVDTALPVFHYEEIRDRILSRHTDVLTAQNDILRARLSLRLARITPIPDVDLQLKGEKDYTAAPHLWTTSIQLTMPVPVWDRNQGNIIQAEALLRSAEEEPHKARDDLYARLADAYGRYATNRDQIEFFRKNILPDSVRGYILLLNRYQIAPARPPAVLAAAPDPTIQDVINAQQNLVTVIQSYLTTLGATWTSVVDVANLMQTDDLFQMSEKHEVPPIPELGPLPCCHPCSPLRDPSLYGGNGPWPSATSEQPAAKKPDGPVPPKE